MVKIDQFEQDSLKTTYCAYTHIQSSLALSPNGSGSFLLLRIVKWSSIYIQAHHEMQDVHIVSMKIYEFVTFRALK